MVAVVSTGTEEMSVGPVLVNQLRFVYTKLCILNPDCNCGFVGCKTCHGLWLTVESIQTVAVMS